MSTKPSRRSMNLSMMLRAMWRTLTDPSFGEKIAPLLEAPRKASPVPAPPAPPTSEKVQREPVPPMPKPGQPPAASLQWLALLQREGRLIDFLMEEIAHLPDAQIGAAVKDIHRQCRQALLDHMKLDGVIDAKEDEAFTVQPGFDPSAIRLTGQLSGQPPFQGMVRHRGWRVLELKLPPVPPNVDPMILAPAEVELS